MSSCVSFGLLLILLSCITEARRGGGRIGGRVGGFSGSRTSGSRSSSRGWGWGGSRSSSSASRYNSYSGGTGRSTSSGGFGLGLGGGLLLGYSLSRPGYGAYSWGHGYNNYNYQRRNNYNTDKPISCYEGSVTQEITGDVALEEELVTCTNFQDVCYGRVKLVVSNKTDTDTSQGFIQVEKGCGIKSDFELEFKDKSDFDSNRDCYVTKLEKSNKIINNNAKGNESLLSDTTSTTTSSSIQEELCFCEGSKCNSGNTVRPQYLTPFILLIICMIR